jgi:hypothetical protein
VEKEIERGNMIVGEWNFGPTLHSFFDVFVGYRSLQEKAVLWMMVALGP